MKNGHSVARLTFILTMNTNITDNAHTDATTSTTTTTTVHSTTTTTTTTTTNTTTTTTTTTVLGRARSYRKKRL